MFFGHPLSSSFSSFGKYLLGANKIGLPAYGRCYVEHLLARLPIPLIRGTVAYDCGLSFPFTAAGQREILTPLPWHLIAVFYIMVLSIHPVCSLLLSPPLYTTPSPPNTVRTCHGLCLSCIRSVNEITRSSIRPASCTLSGPMPQAGVNIAESRISLFAIPLSSNPSRSDMNLS